MKSITGTTDFKLHNTCITMGKFDGMHKGHQLLFHELKKGKEKGYTSCVFTFDYHPYHLFTKKELPLILTKEEKKYLLEKNNPDIYLSYPFTSDTATIEPEDFIRNILVEQLDVKQIVIGEDFRFGRFRRGDVSMLNSFANMYGYEVKVINKLRFDGNIVSSSLIREELEKGNIKYVNELLGYPYMILGIVEHGRKLGRTIGMPTINIVPPEGKLLPPNGVYFSVTNMNGKAYCGVTNIGYKPTVEIKVKRGIETYLFSFNEGIYGKTVAIGLYAYERSERKFHSLEELKKQIEQDVLLGQKYFHFDAEF